MRLPTLRWCPECRTPFRPRATGHRFCCARCRRRNARGLRLRPGARDLEDALRDLLRLLRAGEPIPATLVATDRLRGALDDYEALRGRLMNPGWCGTRRLMTTIRSLEAGSGLDSSAASNGLRGRSGARHPREVGGQPPAELRHVDDAEPSEEACSLTTTLDGVATSGGRDLPALLVGIGPHLELTRLPIGLLRYVTYLPRDERRIDEALDGRAIAHIEHEHVVAAVRRGHERHPDLVVDLVTNARLEVARRVSQFRVGEPIPGSPRARPANKTIRPRARFTDPLILRRSAEVGFTHTLSTLAIATAGKLAVRPILAVDLDACAIATDPGLACPLVDDAVVVARAGRCWIREAPQVHALTLALLAHTCTLHGGCPAL